MTMPEKNKSLAKEPPPAGGNDRLATRLLQIVQGLSDELRRPGEKQNEADLDSRLQDELGIDSISRIELLLRIERELKCALPESIAVEAETPRELLQALSEREVLLELAPSGISLESGEERRLSVGVSTRSRTLIETLEWHAANHPDAIHVFIEGEGGVGSGLTYGELLNGAKRIAGGLSASGLERGSPVPLMFPTGKDFFLTFFGVLFAGGIPVPLYPPPRRDKIEEHFSRQARIIENADARIMIAAPEVRPLGKFLKACLPDLRHFVTPQEILLRAVEQPGVSVSGSDVALIQYTSGSTGDPKGVVLSHENLLSNIRVMGERIEAGPGDTFVSWLPLYHDMGLIGAWLGTLYYGARLVVMSPLSFMVQPARWLNSISKYRGTISAAPNFAYEICASKLLDEDLPECDLSSWRIALNGAEPVSADTLERFTTRFQRFGFKATSLLPVYGLAENSVGLTFPDPGGKPKIDTIDRTSLQRSGRATPVAASASGAMRHVCCGRPLARHEIRIVDAGGRELGAREQGLIQFRGASASSGYYRNEIANRKLFDGGWLNTGDYGYLVDGELYITGREKDIIVRGGRHLHPNEIESALNSLSDVRKGCVAAFGVPDRRSGTEALIIAAETRLRDEDQRAALKNKIRETVSALAGSPPDDVVLLPLRSVLKTPSGKIRRAACRALYESGKLGRQRAAWRQLASLAAQAGFARLRRFGMALGRAVYDAYGYLLLGILAPIAWVLIVVLPSKRMRRSAAQMAARALFILTGARAVLEHASRLPAKDPLIVVSNHSSYLDSLLLSALLPPRFAFVAKRELVRNPVLRLPLERLGTQFVERFEHLEGLEDVERVEAALRGGESIIFFPEGTFDSSTAIRPFRMGAFSLAAKCGVPVVPVWISGTRRALQPDQWRLRRSRLRVAVFEPLRPADESWESAVKLRNEAQEEIVSADGRL